jgi:hypothetical protein
MPGIITIPLTAYNMVCIAFRQLNNKTPNPILTVCFLELILISNVLAEAPWKTEPAGKGDREKGSKQNKESCKFM